MRVPCIVVIGNAAVIIDVINMYILAFICRRVKELVIVAAVHALLSVLHAHNRRHMLQRLEQVIKGC